MFKVLKHGNNLVLCNKKIVRFKCKCCGCVFETDRYLKYGIGSFGKSHIHTTCPDCKHFTDTFARVNLTKYVVGDGNG